MIAIVLGQAGCRVVSHRASPTPCARLYDPPSAQDEALLDDLQRRIVDYFWTEVYPETGIAIDHTEHRVGKVAATGFGLAALCIGAERGWLPRDAVYERVLLTLNSFWDDPDDPHDLCVDGQYGLFWHFVDGHTGRLIPIDCVAICDSADFIAGVLVAGEYFKGTDVETLARKIYDRVEWDRFVSQRPDGGPGWLSFGWVPKGVSETYFETDGLLNFHMNGFADNSLLIHVLALGSDTHPIPQETWEQYVDSYVLDEYAGYECVFAGQLFSRQVPHAFIRFSRKRDRKIDYFLDTVNALLADRQFNIRVNQYPPQLWGLTDCFGKESYTHSAPPGPVVNDGTVGTTAFAGALPHVPALSLEAIRYARETFGDRVFGRYGFTSSINLKNGYISPLYVGIELGPMLLLIENYRSGLIWDLFSRTSVMSNFVKRAEMVGVVDDFELPPEAPPYAMWSAERGTLVLTNDNPRHGRRCLAIRPEAAEFECRGQLTQNDLLDFHFARYLSLGLRDIELTACAVTINGRETVLAPVRSFEDGEWRHIYFGLPSVRPGDAFCAIAIRGHATGPRPAIDDIVLEPSVPKSPPPAPMNFTATPGAIPETVLLRWEVPSRLEAEAVAEYEIVAVLSNQPPRVWRLPASARFGGAEERVLRVGDGVDCRLSVRGRDRHGHWGDPSDSVRTTAAPGQLEPVAYDARRHGLDGWSSWSSDIRLGMDACGGELALRADYQKKHGWSLIAVDLDPMMASLHRYLRITWRGHGDVLAKLWASDQQQGDLRIIRPDPGKDWTVTELDMYSAMIVNPARDKVRKLLLFPEPGNGSATGTIWIAEIRYGP